MSLLPARAVSADGDRSTSDVLSGITVPYEGYLALDGVPMTGTQTVRFELWSSLTSNVATDLVYAETQVIALYNGRFSAAIGAGTAATTTSIEDAILDGEKLYLAIHIADQQNNFIALNGRQAIEAAPYSAWTGNAADMTVAGDLFVRGATKVGSLSAGSSPRDSAATRCRPDRIQSALSLVSERRHALCCVGLLVSNDDEWSPDRRMGP